MLSEKKASIKRERPDHVREKQFLVKDLSHTVDDNIAHGISPILFLLSLSIVAAQLSGEMPQNGITLRQDPPIEINDGDVGGRVHLRDASLLVVRIFFEAVARVVVGNAGIFPHKANDLASAAGFEVEVVDVGDAADGFVPDGFSAAALRGRHLVRVYIPVCLRMVGAVKQRYVGGQWGEKDYEQSTIWFPLAHPTQRYRPAMMYSRHSSDVRRSHHQFSTVKRKVREQNGGKMRKVRAKNFIIF